MQRSDLPKKVTVPANFFEKPKNIWSDQAVFKQMDVQGPLYSYLKSKVARLFDDKVMGGQGIPLEKDSDTKLTLALNAKKSDHLIVGFRLKIGGCQRGHTVKFRVFDRDAITVA